FDRELVAAQADAATQPRTELVENAVLDAGELSRDVVRNVESLLHATSVGARFRAIRHGCAGSRGWARGAENGRRCPRELARCLSSGRSVAIRHTFGPPTCARGRYARSGWRVERNPHPGGEYGRVAGADRVRYSSLRM